MGLETRSTDAKGRVSLPKAFANATVIIEQVSENELRIRKARVIPEDELRVDALDTEAKAFYERFGFVPLTDDPMRLFLPLSTIQAAVQP